MTPKQIAILAFIEGYFAEYGTDPKYTEIMEGLSLRSRKSVDRLLAAATKQQRIDHQARTAPTTEKPYERTEP